MSVTVRTWIRSAVVGLIVAMFAVLLRGALTPLWGARFVFTFSFPAVVIAAWYGRLPAGLICTAILTFAAAYYYVEPAGQLHVGGADDLLALTLFAVFGVLVSSIIDRLQDEIHRSKG